MGRYPLPPRDRRRTAILVLGIGFALAAQGADLLDAYRLARESDPTFEVARYTLEAVAQKIPQARASLLPTVNLTGNDNRTQANTTFTNTPPVERDVRAWTWGVQLTQPLVRVAAVYAYSESQALVDQAQADFDLANQTLILRVTQAYFDVLVAGETLTAADAQVRAMDEQWSVARRGYETGVAAITDMHEAKSKLDQAKSQRIAARNDLEIKRTELERMIGPLPASLAALRPDRVTPLPNPDDSQAWVTQAKESHPSVRGYKAALEASDAAVGKNRSQHLPTLDLTSSYGANFSSGTIANPVDFGTRARSRVTGVQLTIPIFEGGGVESRVDEAMANRNKTRAQLEEARRKAGAEAKQAYAAIASGLSQIEALQSAVASGVSAVDGNRRGYALGIRINSDVLAAEQQLFISRRDLAKARYDTLLQGLKLKAAAGVLNEDDLLAVNGMMFDAKQSLATTGEQLKVPQPSVR